MTGRNLLERVVEGQIRKRVQALEVIIRGTVGSAERRAREQTGSDGRTGVRRLLGGVVGWGRRCH